MPRSIQSPLSRSKAIRKIFLLVTGVLGFSIVSSSAFSADWMPVVGGEITEVLSGIHVVYEGRDGVSQTFHAGGSTTYVDGRPSIGNWRASNTQYCSQWPPSSDWECYDLFKDGTGMRIRFLGASGDEWIAKFKE